jgi:hypothetical protein
MSELRIRMKFGEHEFEAEGLADAVERQLESFKQLIAPGQAAALSQRTAESPEDQRKAAPPALERIMRIRGRILSLSVTATAADAVLVILLGQRNLRQNDSVSGTEIMRGLRDSGIRIPRADTILTKHAGTGSVIAMGERRRRRYRLSSAGVEQAQQIALSLIALVP